jgi:histidyl-tRNA synthetase
MERLAILLSQAGPYLVAAPEFYVVSRGEQAEPLALQLARQLRQAGHAVDLDLTGAAFGKQFKRADRAGARWAVVIGDSEAEAGVVLLKDLRGVSGEASEPEQRLSRDELLRHFA